MFASPPMLGPTTPLSRRNALQWGVAGIGGLTLPQLLQMRAEAGTGKRPRSVIMVCLAGGPSHLDTYDLKPEAPVEFRGEFKPIATNVPGFDICHLFPRQARIADKLALVRSLQFVEPMQHELEEVYSGYPKSQQRPSFGSVVSYFQDKKQLVPSYVSLEYAERLTSYENPRYLGTSHSPLHVAGGAGVQNLKLLQEISAQRFGSRKELLQSFDRIEQSASSQLKDADNYTVRAFEIMNSPQVREAFDLTKEPDVVRERYGYNTDKYIYVGPQADTIWNSQDFLLARRLVEAGVPVVTLRAGLWDHHGNVIQQVGGKSIWHSLETMLPLLDRSVHALVTDLHERGLDQEVLVLVWGEFGRTPKISLAGRDHWPDASFALLAGAVKTGQVIGQTDPHGERPTTRALGPQNILGTLYHALGIDPTQMVRDFSGRPVQLLDSGTPIVELVT